MTNTQVYEKYLTVEDRSEVGEVTTPVSLAEEMVDRIPSHIFESEDTTFLDPCYGNGTFIVEIIKRLRASGHSMESIENRIYGFELSMRLFNKTSRLLSRYNFRKLYNKDFLKTDINMKFDVIIGNPPYQDGNANDQGHKLWPIFVKDGFNLLKEGGVLSMVHPTGWMNVDSADTGTGKSAFRIYKDIFQKNQVGHICINDTRLKGFFKGVGSTFSYYTVYNKPATESTLIESEGGKTFELFLPNQKRLPSTVTDNSISIFNKFESKLREKFPRFYGQSTLRDIKKTEDSEYSTKLYHTPAKGGTYVYSKTACRISEPYKVAISLSGKYVPKVLEGGVSPMCLTIGCNTKEEANNTFSIINSKLYRYFVESNKFSGFNPSTTISNLPYLDTSIEWTDQMIYDHFNITGPEIEEIDRSLK